MTASTAATATTRDSGDSSSSQPSSFRFSLSGLLIFMLGLGVGLSVERQPGLNRADGLMAAFGAWMFIGLANQAYDLCVTLKRPRGGEQRFGLIFSLAWRLVLIAGLLGFYVLRLSGQESVLWARADEDDFNGSITRRMSAHAIWALIILSSCFSGACFREFKSETWWNRILNALGVFVGAAWCFVAAQDQWVVTFLVHAATRGVEGYQPLRRNGVDIYPANLHNDLYGAFEGGGVMSMSLTLCVVGFILLLARYWHSARRRCILLIAVAGCFAGQFALLAWCYRSAIPELSPFLAPLLLSRPWQNYLFGLTFIALTAWLASYLLTREMAPAPAESVIHWRRRPLTYYHEYLLVATLLAAALAVQSVKYLHDYFGWKEVLWAIVYLPLHPTLMLNAAVLVLVMRTAIGQWKRQDQKPESAGIRLAPGKFVTLWFLSFGAACSIAASGPWFALALLLSMRRT